MGKASTSTSTSTSSTTKDALALFNSLRSAYSATPTTLKIIDLYVCFAVSTALIQVVYMAIVGSFPFNSFLSGVLSCTGTAVLAVCLRIQVNKENKDFKDLPPERAFADFVLCNLVLHLGVVDEEKVDSFNIPNYLMSSKELENAVERNGCFSIERRENLDNFFAHDTV